MAFQVRTRLICMEKQDLNISRFASIVDGYINGLGTESFDFAMLLIDWKNGNMQTLTRMESGPFGPAGDIDTKIAYHMKFMQLLTEADPGNPEGLGVAFTQALTKIMVQTCAADPEFHKNFEYLIGQHIGEIARQEAEYAAENGIKLKEQVIDTDGEQGESAAAAEEAAA